MARLTITLDGKTADLPDACIPRLQAQLDRTTPTRKTAVPLLDWLARQLQELAIGNDLATLVPLLQQQQEAAANASLAAAINTARDELIAALATPAVAGSGTE